MSSSKIKAAIVINKFVDKDHSSILLKSLIKNEKVTAIRWLEACGVSIDEACKKSLHDTAEVKSQQTLL